MTITATMKTVAITTDADRAAAQAEIARLSAAPRHSSDAQLMRSLTKAVTHYDEAKERIGEHVTDALPMVPRREPDA